MSSLRDDLLQVRAAGVNFYVLRDQEGLYLIDGGFIGGRFFLKQALRKKGWEEEQILGIIVTHGHLDHILNIGKLAEKTGAWVAAPRQDLRHYEGRPRYQGLGRITGCLEAVGRVLLRFQKFTPTRLFEDGDSFDIWHGLKVVHLPGHTEGHSGLYCEKLNLLFSADLFASFGRFSHLPPSVFNSDSQQAKESVMRALELELEGVLPNHASSGTLVVHLDNLRNVSLRK